MRKHWEKKIEIYVELQLVQGCNQIKSSSECPTPAELKPTNNFEELVKNSKSLSMIH